MPIDESPSGDHEHDGSGCSDCDCLSAWMNLWPCTCPPKYRMKVEGQVSMHFPGDNPNSYGGEMVVHQEGRDITVNIRLAEPWATRFSDSDISVALYPRPAVQKPKVVVDDHIILGEN